MKRTQFQKVSVRPIQIISYRTRFLAETLRKKIILLILVSSVFLLPNAFAQSYTQWDLPDGAKARLGKGSVGGLKFSADGNRLMVANAVGIWVYDAYSGVALDLITRNLSDSLALSPDGSTVAGWGPDDKVCLWHIADSQNKLTLQGDTSKVRRMTFSPDSRTVAGGTSDDKVILWDVASGTRKTTLIGHTHVITSVAFSPDGSTLASGSWDETVRLWDVAAGVHKITLTAHTEGISNIAFSPDSRTFVSSSFNEDKVILWDVGTWQQKAALNTDINCFALSPDSSTLTTGSWRGELHLWDVASGAHKAEFLGHPSGIFSVAFSPDGKTLASGGVDKLYLWDIDSGTRKLSITGHTDGVYSIAFSPDSKTLASGSREQIHLWDIGTSTHEATLFVGDWATNASLDFSPDGNMLASEAGSLIHLWDVNSRTHSATIRRHDGTTSSYVRYRSIALSRDGRFLARSASNSVQLWYVGRTYKKTLTGHTDEVTSVAFSYDSRTLASGSVDHTVRLWDVDTDVHKATFAGHTDIVVSVAFSPDGSRLASGSDDNTIILWDVDTGEPRTTIVAHTNGINDVVFSPDGKTLASGGYRDDTTVKLWDVDTGALKTTFFGHTYGITEIAFSPDGQTLASGGWDGTILLWDLTPEITAEIETPQLAEDANDDGVIDLQDLVFVASQFGQSGGENTADINRDGVVDIADILLVAGALETGNGAPSAYARSIGLLTAGEVEQWLIQAQQVNDKGPVFQRGIAALQKLLAVLTPKETMLLPNYPNPFNPETWIPYQLAETAGVTIRIYATSGESVRTLVLGSRPAGIYQSRGQAAYWDGKNEFGEPVASGIYFYTLSAGRFTATRRMVIRK
ncbi:MAG: T9SS type A sorting domain-containing protein [Candidatus Poribacteria bacterium]|nr:T9SS type A sorting domain-containing protein [Candidatus Poribacteria bacterium]